MTQRAFQRGLAGAAATPDGQFLQCIYRGANVFTGSSSLVLNYVAERAMQICRVDVIVSSQAPSTADFFELAKNGVAITPAMDLRTGITSGTLITAATYNTPAVNRVAAGDTLSLTASFSTGTGPSLQVFIYYVAA